MGIPVCEICGSKLVKNGKTKAGKQRWLCKNCSITKVNTINNDAKLLESFLRWLFSKKTQAEMPGCGRTFRRKTAKFWEIWPLPPICDEIHKTVYTDGIYLGRKAVVLIACADKHIIGWYLARTESTHSWACLMSRIAPPIVVVSDGGVGFKSAQKKVWPTTEVQRCTYHAYRQVARLTTMRPKLQAGVELLGIAKELTKIKERNQAELWVVKYLKWCKKWNSFLQEKTQADKGYEFTHARLVQARNSLSRLINSGELFTYLDELLTLDGPIPDKNNRIEGGVNSCLRQMLREHRGLSLTRRAKAIFWYCYMHTECPLKPSEILEVMPTDADIEYAYSRLDYAERSHDSIPQWGDAIVWSELHHSDPYRKDWD